MSRRPTLLALTLGIMATGITTAYAAESSSTCDLKCQMTELPAKAETRTTVTAGQQTLTPEQQAAKQVAESPRYRAFVPSTYNGSVSFPLVVVLHPSGADENAPFMARQLAELAEKKGYIVVAPLGYDSTAGYGSTYPIVQTFAAKDGMSGITIPNPQSNYLSEVAVMSTLAKVKREMNIDASRVYLMGYGMGSIGAQHLAAKYPNEWAAIAPASGAVTAASYPFSALAANHVAALYIQGEKDRYTPANAVEDLYNQARRAGVDARLIKVPNADNSNAWVGALPQTFDFFSNHRKY